MTAFFARQRLIRRGLASAKFRRRLTRSEWVQTLQHGGAARILVLLLMALFILRGVALGAGEAGLERLIVGVLIYTLVIALLWMNHQPVWRDNGRLLLLLGVMGVHLETARWLTGSASDVVALGASDWGSEERRQVWALLVPYALGPLIISVLMGQRLGIVTAIFGSLFGAMMHGELDARFLVTGLLCGFVAALMTRDVRRRGDLVRAGFVVGLSTLALSLLLGALGPVAWDNLQETHWKVIAWQAGATMVSGVGAALLVSAVLPILEGLFRITTSITWLELADLNHPLLKRMTLEAPGTYHHSLMVAQLSEAAAEAIGANAAMARVCSYFHDIGKLVKPEYFIENARHGRNAHEDLAPTMSALVIVAHVKEGVDLALKHRLNREIIDVIQQHHGTSVVYYFYQRALRMQEEMRQQLPEGEEDLPEVREDSFRYHGPNPQTRECAIISLADSVESASRSLDKVTPHKIDQLVDELIQKRLAEGQLQECDLKMTELVEVAESFKRTLRSMMHTRIAYPKASERPRSQHSAARVPARARQSDE